MPSSNSKAARLMILSLTLSPCFCLAFESSGFRIDKRCKTNKQKITICKNQHPDSCFSKHKSLICDCIEILHLRIMLFIYLLQERCFVYLFNLTQANSHQTAPMISLEHNVISLSTLPSTLSILSRYVIHRCNQLRRIRVKEGTKYQCSYQQIWHSLPQRYLNRFIFFNVSLKFTYCSLSAFI